MNSGIHEFGKGLRPAKNGTRQRSFMSYIPAKSGMPPMRIILRGAAREMLAPPVRLTDAQIKFYASPAFTRSGAWVRLRYDFIRDHGGRCQACGRGGDDGRRINVDHILPRKTHPQLAMSYANLQTLCTTCNRGKGNRDCTDWRFTKHIGKAVEEKRVCKVCGAEAVARRGRKGPFWGCCRFPECRATEDRKVDVEC